MSAAYDIEALLAHDAEATDPVDLADFDPDTDLSDISRDALRDAIHREGPTMLDVEKPEPSNAWAPVPPTLVLPDTPPARKPIKTVELQHSTMTLDSAPTPIAPPRPEPPAKPTRLHGWPVSQLVAVGAVALLVIVSSVLAIVLATV